MNSSKPVAELTTPIHCLKGIGPKRRRDLERAGLRSLEDMLYYLPFRFEDRRTLRSIASLKPGENALVSARVVAAEVQRTRRRNFKIFSAVVEDESGRMLASWFNQPFLADTIRPGYKIRLFGEARAGGKGAGILEMANPQFEVGAETKTETGIVPVYERIGSVGGKTIRTIIKDLFNGYEISLPGNVPSHMLSRLKLLPPGEALARIHCPPPDADIESLNSGSSREHRSLVFEEFFFLQAGLAFHHNVSNQEGAGIKFQTSPEIRKMLKGMLPFRLTEGQRNALKEIVGDMTSARQMRRLLQGDVGCGKTIVALLAAALAMENGYQAAFMVPTEILAEQHYASVRKHLAKTNYRVGLLNGSMTAGEKEKMRRRIADGEVDLVVGTHALIQEATSFKQLGFSIIDEQHRFGVIQRGRMMKAGANPDVLIMTATPIPRSLTLTLFGDLSVSLIKDVPPGRRKVKTAARTEKSRTRIDAFLESQMKEGRQIYAVAPAIEESKNGELRTATDLHERLSATFPHRRVGLLHGRMKAAQREKTMAEFADGKIDILACTTVIEVGVDVPNATVMLVENAERFGLSQLHQLRGRVGRGRRQSYCVLLYSSTRSDPARERLKIMVKTNDGFLIAEKDLELRGPGEFFGARQSGSLTLRVGNVVRDLKELQAARKEAFRLMLNPDPEEIASQQKVVNAIRKSWAKRYNLVLIG